MAQVDFKDDFKSFLTYLRADKKFYFNTKEELLKGFEDVCENQIRPVLHKAFYKLPNSKLVWVLSYNKTTWVWWSVW